MSLPESRKDRLRYHKIQQYILCGLTDRLFPTDKALERDDNRESLTIDDLNEHIDSLPDEKYE